MPPDRRREAGEIRWWMPIAGLAGLTVALVFAAWIGGVDMHAAAERMADRLDETFHDSSWQIHDERGRLEIEFDRHDAVRKASHDGRLLAPDEIRIEDGYLTVTSLAYEDGELMYWRLPLQWEDELRESCRNPRWRLQLRVHPLPEGEPAGLRCARLDPDAAAGRAGVRAGDVIVSVAGQGAATSAELEARLQHVLATLAPGGTLELGLLRDGQPLALSMPLEPLVSRAEWDELAIEDPVERFLAVRMPWRHRDRLREAEATQEVPPDVPPAPPPPPEAPGDP